MAGDRTEEFSEFFRQTSGRLLATAYLLTGDRHRAEDLAQTAYAKTYASWSRVRRADAYAFTRKVLVNTSIDLWRLRSSSEQTMDTVPELEDQFDHAAAVADREAVTAALTKLTRRERAVVVLRYYADASEAEVASTLKISAGTVKSTVFRALAKLRTDPAFRQGKRPAPKKPEPPVQPAGGGV